MWIVLPTLLLETDTSGIAIRLTHHLLLATARRQMAKLTSHLVSFMPNNKRSSSCTADGFMAPVTNLQFSQRTFSLELITFAGNITYHVNFNQLICTPSNFCWLILLQHDLELPLEMADLKVNPATPSNYSFDQTIVFLRPTTEDAILWVNATQNDYSRFEVAPPEEPTDSLVEETLDEELTKTISEVIPQSHIPIKAAPHIHPFALRLGFDTIEIHLEIDLQLGV